MRRYLNRKDNKIGFNFEGLSFINIVVREVNPVDEFYFERSTSSDDGKECLSFTDPIRMLFNQQRLSQLGNTAVEAWLDSLKNFKKDPFAELRSKCTDDELKAVIKSRFIQQPSELMAYAEECKNNMDTFDKALKEYQQAVLEKQEQSATPSSVPTDNVDKVESKTT